MNFQNNRKIMFDLYLQSKIIMNYFFIISVSHVEGPILNLHKVSRLDMGAYMCIATNGVPPIISKRIHLNVDCEYDFSVCFFLLNERDIFAYFFNLEVQSNLLSQNSFSYNFLP